MDIFACKLYRASSRKNEIKAAMENPLNKELVTQLRSYLDDEYLTREYFPEDTQTEKVNVKVDTQGPEGGMDSPPHTDFGGRSTSFSPGELDLEDNLDLDTEEGEELPDDEEELLDTEEPEEDVEESTYIKGKSVKSATALYTPPEVDTNILTSAIPIIKGTLNSREDTQGVDNIFVKDKELWIYYNDSVNLNNVMTVVIEILNSVGYSYLTFNRLARKDNAMVFDIVLPNNYIEPIEEQEDGEK